MLRDEPVAVGWFVGFNDLTNLHNEWLKKFLYSQDDLTLQGHRGSYKTTTLSLFLAIHAVIKPNETVLFFRKTANDVTEVMRQTGKVLQSGCMNELVRAIYGHDLEIDTLNSNTIHTNLPTRAIGAQQIYGQGLGTSVTGKHADIIVTDDIVNVNDRVSSAEREATKRAYMELQNIKNRGGRFINTGTPWHKEDAFSLMPNPERYDCYSTGLMSASEIEDIRSKMSPSLFAANYELKHIASEDVLFPRPVIGADPALVEQGICHIDAAYDGEDYTAFTIMRRFNGKYYVFGKIWRKHIDDVVDQCIEYRKHFLAGKIYCEINADKGYLGKDLKRRGERAVLYNETMNKHLKIATYLKSIWNDVEFVLGTDMEYIDMITDYNENAEHDDAPDSCACLARLLWRKANNSEYTPMIYA